jgi:pyruvate dehydrogenase E2 component (dihydrolipoamide acetyltransferase)
MMDVDSYAPIVNPGRSATLGVASTQPQPVVRDDKIVVRLMMKLTLSCNRRIVDGALGAKFVNAIKHKLEDIELWKRLTA